MLSSNPRDLQYWSWLLQTRRERLEKFQNLEAPDILIDVERALIQEAESEVEALQKVSG